MATKIAIVGAGCAGLGAATHLMGQKEVDVDVTLIEANDWIGGRARTSPDPLAIDLGPQFIQDPEVNPWTVILHQMPNYDQDEIEPIEVNTYYRVRADNKWKTEIGSDGITKGNDMLEDGYRQATGFSNAPILSKDSTKIFKGQEDLSLALGSSGYGAISESVEPWEFIASDQARQGHYDSAGNIYVPGGLGNLVQNYGKKLLAGNALALHLVHQKVTAIDDQGDKLVVTTADEEERNFDYGIVTVPSPQIAGIAFTPPLSGPWVRANAFIKLGYYKKVAFRPQTFPVGAAEDTIKEKTEYYIYDGGNDGVWQYFRLPTDPSILLCVTAGSFAMVLDEATNETAAGLIMKLLKAAYPTGDFTPKDNRVVVSNWTNTPNIGGAYSYTSYDDQLDPDNPVPLQARLEIARPHGRIHFAGEATWPDAYGTIHGAYHSGVRAAKEILAAIGSS